MVDPWCPFVGARGGTDSGGRHQVQVVRRDAAVDRRYWHANGTRGRDIPINMADLTSCWELRWPACPPIGYELRTAYPERWVRFHSLPGSKRHAEDDNEYATVLNRYNTVLDELFLGQEVLVLTPEWTSDPAPSAHATAAGSYWTSARVDPDDPAYTHIFVRQVRWERGCINEVLRAVADFVVAGVMITDVAVRRIYHPYDGGADVLLETSADRDRLRAKYSDWLSTHPQGL